MASPAGLSGYIGFKKETNWGTAVSPDIFHEGFTGGGFAVDQERIPSMGLRAGRRVTSVRKPGPRTVSGTVNLELWSEPLVGLLEQMFGKVETSGNDPYTHVATPDGLSGKSLTVQIVKPDSGGTLHGFDYPGAKVTSWTLECSVGELAQLQLEMSAKDEEVGTAETASYGSGSPFVFTEASVKVAGSPVATVTSLTLTGGNELREDGHRLGSSLIREQLENGMREYAGELTTEFEGLTQYQRFLDADQVSLEVEFDNGSDSLTIVANIMFDGSTPELDGPELLEQSLPFTCLSATSDADAITATLVNGEASA